ncbi:MAG: ABC transporter substrate-binding protein [Actinomycetota bacterium]|nr:ABC transporter substrate-binding protein [Actinomycetota bacterium]
MKRSFIWMVALVALLLVAAACSSDSSDTTAAGGGETETTAAGGGETDTTAAPDTGETVELVIESWRNDDLSIWQDKLIPAFEADNPGIKVTFAPTAPAEYNAVLQGRLEGGTAGDLITCRPFDASLDLYDAGHLADITDLSGMENFSSVAQSAWITDDGTQKFCVPMASVIHGFIYNADAFTEVGVEVPTTEDEFFAALDTIKADGTYDALAMGTADQWEAATMGFQNIGPNYWMGETGRTGLIEGTEKLTDQQYVDTLTTLAKWSDYMPDGFEAIAYPDSQALFTLGGAAIYPAGSWEIGLFNEQAEFAMGAFMPPVKADGDTCYISDHTDIALGMNPASANSEAAKTFLTWVASADFASMYANSLPGFFSLSNHSVTMEDPLAQEFLSWRDECESTIRNSYQILSRGEPNLENEIWAVSATVINGTATPEDGAAILQEGLEQWYEPQQG